MLPLVNQVEALAHLTESNLAPVFHHRVAHVRNPSWQAVILSAMAGTMISLSSASVRVPTSAAITPPPDVPVMIVGIRLASKWALTTPK